MSYKKKFDLSQPITKEMIERSVAEIIKEKYWERERTRQMFWIHQLTGGIKPRETLPHEN